MRGSTSVGRSVQALLKTLKNFKSNLNGNEIRKAYTCFEVLTAHSYSFSCNLCGVSPSTLMTDVCSKSYCSMSVLDKSEMKDGPRDIQHFWHMVSLSIITQSESRDLIDECAPWICPQNVHNIVVI